MLGVSNPYGFLDSPDGVFTAVAAGKEHSLAIILDGSVVCWGENTNGPCNAPGVNFVQIAAGRWHSLGLRGNGEVRCWGNNSYGQCDAPSGPFAAVAAGAILKKATARVASLRLRIAQDVRSAVAKGREQDNEVLELGGAVTVHIAVRRPPR